jgi:hypothetical protein
MRQRSPRLGVRALNPRQGWVDTGEEADVIDIAPAPPPPSLRDRLRSVWRWLWAGEVEPSGPLTGDEGEE